MKRVAINFYNVMNEIVNKVMEHYDTLNNDYVKGKCKEDTKYTLQYLYFGLQFDSVDSFISYTRWLRDLLTGLGLREDGIKENYGYILSACKELLKPRDVEIISGFIVSAIEDFEIPLETFETFLKENNIFYRETEQYISYILANETDKAYELVKSVLKKHELTEVYINLFQVAQYEIGLYWQKGKINVAQEHLATATTQIIMSRLYPMIVHSKNQELDILVACVGNELHEIGARMVSDVLESSGYNTMYIGSNTPVDSVKLMIDNQNIDVVVVSTTMLRNVEKVSDLITDVKLSYKDKSPRFVVGGYPFNQDKLLWKAVGADGYSSSIEDIVETVRRVVDDK